MKASPLPFIRAHFATYVDDSTGRQRWRDHIWFHGLPLLTFALLGWFEVAIPNAASVGLITVMGFLSAFLFGAMLQVAQRALDWSDKEPVPGEDTTAHAEYLRQLAANTGYASLISIVTAGAFVVAAAATQEELVAGFTALGLALTVHLVLILLMVMGRVLALTDSRLIRAETGGASQTRISVRRGRRAASKP